MKGWIKVKQETVVRPDGTLVWISTCRQPDMPAEGRYETIVLPAGEDGEPIYATLMPLDLLRCDVHGAREQHAAMVAKWSGS